jgi:hypothetical protein
MTSQRLPLLALSRIGIASLATWSSLSGRGREGEEENNRKLLNYEKIRMNFQIAFYLSVLLVGDSLHINFAGSLVVRRVVVVAVLR